MNTIVNLLRQEAIGVFRLSIPILLIAYMSPELLFTLYGQIACSWGVGFLIFYQLYTQTKNQATILQFAPSEQNKTMFDQIIETCNFRPETVNLRYGYSNEGLALTMFNTISIDPLIFQDLENDPEALKLKTILETYTIPTMSELQKKRIECVKEIASTSVLQFIFKHELGHVFYNYSFKIITMMATIGFIAAFCGIATAIVYFHLLNKAAILLGMIVGGIIDLTLSYSSNYFFKAQAEKNADLFAAHHSTAEEIKAAVDFFEKHQEIYDTYPQPGILAKLPSAILTGHQPGKTRACYLRKLLRNSQPA